MSVKDGERAFRELQRLLRVYGAATIVETYDYSGLSWSIYHDVIWHMSGGEMGEIGHGGSIKLTPLEFGFEVYMYSKYYVGEDCVTMVTGHMREDWDNVERVRKMRADD